MKKELLQHNMDHMGTGGKHDLIEGMIHVVEREAREAVQRIEDNYELPDDDAILSLEQLAKRSAILYAIQREITNMEGYLQFAGRIELSKAVAKLKGTKPEDTLDAEDQETLSLCDTVEPFGEDTAERVLKARQSIAHQLELKAKLKHLQSDHAKSILECLRIDNQRLLHDMNNAKIKALIDLLPD